MVTALPPLARHSLPGARPMSTDSQTPPPAGFVPHTRRSPLTEPWEPLFAREQGTALQLGLWLRPAHCNGRGFAHGGLLSALADNAMGLSAVRAAQAGGLTAQGAVTVSLALDFIGSGQVGQWLEVRPVVLKAGRTLAFVECHLLGDDQMVARGSATFRLQ